MWLFLQFSSCVFFPFSFVLYSIHEFRLGEFPRTMLSTGELAPIKNLDVTIVCNNITNVVYGVLSIHTYAQGHQDVGSQYKVVGPNGL